MITHPLRDEVQKTCKKSQDPERTGQNGSEHSKAVQRFKLKFGLLFI